MDDVFPHDEPRFIADRMLGKLARYLVMLGYDTFYISDEDRPRLVKIACAQGRKILSRDTRLVRQPNLPSCCFVRDNLPVNQLKQVMRHFGLTIDPARHLTRCLRCNQRLVKADVEEVKHALPPYILAVHREFSVCPGCRRVYWKGSHRKRMETMIRDLSSR